jgi:hypothetical protein
VWAVAPKPQGKPAKGDKHVKNSKSGKKSKKSKTG